MSEFPVSEDPRFVRWQSFKSGSVLTRNITCIGYAAADDQTLSAIEKRGIGNHRAPELGNASGLPWQLYCMAHKPTAENACKLAERDGMIPVKVDANGPLPIAPAGQRLVAMFFGKIDGIYDYDWKREHNGLWTGKPGHNSIPAMTDSAGRLMRDPRKFHVCAEQQGPFFFLVPVQGIDMQLSPQLETLLDNALLEQRRLASRRDKISPTLAGHFESLARLMEPQDKKVAAGLEHHAYYYRTGKRSNNAAQPA